MTSQGRPGRRRLFDARIALPYIVLLVLNALGLLMVIPRFLHVPGLGWLWDGTHPGTIITNALWTSFNIVILSVCIAVAREARQTRQHVRINFAAPVRVHLADGRTVPGQTIDVSSGGLAMELLEGMHANQGEALKVIFPLRTGDAELPATVVGLANNVLRLQFDPLTVAEEEMLTMVLSRAPIPAGSGRIPRSGSAAAQPGPDHPHRVSRIRDGVLVDEAHRNGQQNKRKKAQLTAESLILLLALGLAGWGARARAQTSDATPPAAAATAPAEATTPAATTTPAAGSLAGSFKSEQNLFDLGVPGPSICAAPTPTTQFTSRSRRTKW